MLFKPIIYPSASLLALCFGCNMMLNFFCAAEKCLDHSQFCLSWAKKGECSNNPRSMRTECRHSCRLCEDAHPATTSNSCALVREKIPRDVRAQFMISDWHTKYTEAYGVPIVGSQEVSDAALSRACYLVRFLFADSEANRAAFVRNRNYVGIVGRNERISDMPEYQETAKADPDGFNKRGRAYGATEVNRITSMAEENLLCAKSYEDDKWYEEDISLHELAHSYHLLGAAFGTSDFADNVGDLYRRATNAGLYAGTYAGENEKEYFAEGVQSYFDQNICRKHPDGIHFNVCTRATLKEYDAPLHDFLAETFACENEFVKRCDSDQHAAETQVLKQRVDGQCIELQ